MVSRFSVTVIEQRFPIAECANPLMSILAESWEISGHEKSQNVKVTGTGTGTGTA